MEDSISMALEIVKAQAGVRSMNEEEITSMLRAVSVTLQRLSTDQPICDGSAQEQKDPAKAIGDKHITCLECDKNFKIITSRHLLSHGLSAEEYRSKWGYAKRMPLVCKSLQKERRKKMKGMKLWEKRRGAKAKSE